LGSADKRSAERTSASAPSDAGRNTREYVSVKIACDKVSKLPSIILPSKDLIEERANFMIYTKFNISLNKKKSLNENAHRFQNCI